MAVAVWGARGWIGGQVCELLEARGAEVVRAESRLEDRAAIEAELDRTRPDRVIVAAGVTGRPNVDWCEEHRRETIRANVIGTLNVVDVCTERGLHVMLFATGCIFSYDEEHALGSGKGFTEDDRANFAGSFYSRTKGMVEELLRCYPPELLLVLRVRMPISADLSCPRNFITKITRYERVVNIPNSVSVLPDLLPVAIEMSRRRIGGIFNFCNPGVVSHNECLELYREFVDPSFTWTNFTEQEQAKVLKAARSNNELDCSKLLAAVPDLRVPPIQESLRKLFQEFKTSRS
ncbi:5-epimerase/dTDP-4-dehydrorhamnose reductase (dTDP-L-rhamnose synthase) [Durusdinium trenchii]|uniref:5-epimerase/dTDP-4-dehydrorhamnose reductase (dTDP-L-rhamnose synthase) n=1 Tax=Durusdinium trenchii TaxID=1381693 RepID=A0ABP0M912_9DINO